jgi:adenylate cyclase class 2
MQARANPRTVKRNPSLPSQPQPRHHVRATLAPRKAEIQNKDQCLKCKGKKAGENFCFWSWLEGKSRMSTKSRPGLNSGKIEVELKAWLESPEKIKRKLRKIARFEAEIKEEDIYFTFAHTSGYQWHRFRLRTIGRRSIVTVKVPNRPTSEPGAGIEANREYEFAVSNPEAFKVFCREFGFRVLIEKHKRVRRYLLKPGRRLFAFPVHIELNHIENLGDFIELETLVEKEEQVPRASAFINSLLDTLGVPRSRIEPRAYTEMLYQQSQKQSPQS